DKIGSSGTWFLQRGMLSPLNAFPVPPPSQETAAAMTDQAGAGTHLLTQDIVISPAALVTPGFDLFLNNQAGAFFTAASPVALGGFPNQQFRVDILNPAATDFDVGAGVLATLYRTAPNSPPQSGYRRLTFDITAFTGRTVRLRFAEVDNSGYLTAAIDQVS